MNNILLSNFILPPFNKIKYDLILEAIKIIINNCYKNIESLIKKHKNNYTWDNFCQPIFELDEQLNRVFSIINHLNYVQNTNSLRDIYTNIIKIVTNYNLWISNHKEIYNIYNYINNNDIVNKKLNKLQKISINNILRDFRLSGILLTKEKNIIYNQIIKRLSILQIKFNNNIFDSSISWKYNVLDQKILEGIPKNIIIILKKQAINKKKQGYLITLDLPIYLSILTHSKNIYLRKKIYYAYNVRASTLDTNIKWDNFPIIMEELSLRCKLSNLFGYHTYSQHSIITKSAQKLENVLNFLNKLVKLVSLQAKQEVYDLKLFIKKKYNITDFNPWDIMFFSEQYKSYLYNINDELIREYFPIDNVIFGMFTLINKIYGLVFKKRQVEIWDPYVIFFDVFDKNNILCGSIYFDLYIRQNKRSGAWMDICQTRMLKSNNKLQYPVAYVNCNFNYESEHITLLNHTEVLTLFHEFGHALHHIVSKINITNISGINGIPLDIVEFPSQFMEYWCWEPKVIKLISRHYQNNISMPSYLIKRLIDSKKYHAALYLMRQLELSLLDINLHNINNNNINKTHIIKIINNIRKNIITILPIPSWNKSLNSFSHIFGGEYSAGYYSYLWAEQLAADAFDYFKINGLFNPIIGKNFFDNILSIGCSQNILVAFKKFRGRELNIQSLIKHKGIKI
ncbi:M3 family metallopeptidase [Enterobacteriaceae endosymbiont of Neohaemonia nigricornis]|uniref:M3 family metallopeptidase n=1 Tax=Enterobacteriaceae endosymbiont of Neohaemonia nigricornis TaxID=2675792 RepID=UPI00144A22F3|nr:M3 family metallopeptidase [Enterobacteriaceae endosymbiont of Neohaemonia nigricornis]QJC30367.1 oligopeptidase A [Enterobacteriaceae endosymbiont of Neohaemonia nigricornis]